MWRTHKNRVDQGLGGTCSPSGIHEGSRQDHNMINPVMSISGRQMIEGTDETMAFDNPFLRWHKSFENYSGHLYDIDDHTLHGSDEFERLKKYTPDDKYITIV